MEEDLKSQIGCGDLKKMKIRQDKKRNCVESKVGIQRKLFLVKNLEEFSKWLAGIEEIFPRKHATIL